MMVGGADVLDALIAGVNILELDPEEDSVRLRRAPQRGGVWSQLDSLLHARAPNVARAASPGSRASGRRRRWRKIDDGPDRSPSDRRGRGAGVRPGLRLHHRGRPQHRALPEGLAGVEAPGPTRSTTSIPTARAPSNDRRQSPRTRLLPTRVAAQLARAVPTAPSTATGINAKGEICGVTTTSGLSWKIPGRVGDFPILGAGLYVDGAVGAAGSTGRGEANLYNLCSFLIVENLRRGMHPKDAGLDALKRVRLEHRRAPAPPGQRRSELQPHVLRAERPRRARGGFDVWGGRRLPRVGGEHRPRVHEVRGLRREGPPHGAVRGAHSREAGVGRVVRRVSS